MFSLPGLAQTAQARLHAMTFPASGIRPTGWATASGNWREEHARDGKPESVALHASRVENVERAQAWERRQDGSTWRNNRPAVVRDPQGLPREDLYELRTTQILQTPLSVGHPANSTRSGVISGPTGGSSTKIRPSRGGSSAPVGKWEDDDTFVVTATGRTKNVARQSWPSPQRRPDYGGAVPAGQP